jgi:serine protease Do
MTPHFLLTFDINQTFERDFMNVKLPLRFLMTTVLLSGTFHLPAVNPTQQKTVLQDFTGVAKVAIPAVVSIQVKSYSKESPFVEQRNYQDFFGDELWQHFFGIPRGRSYTQPEAQMAQASGFIVSEDGYVLTNSHVVKDATEIEVTLNDGREYKAKLIGQDPNTDIALIKIDAKGLPFLILAESDEIEVGQWVAAIGNPMGLQATLTAGIVSAKGRNNLDIVRIEDFIQTDAAINRGNSGGPLLNMDGQVIGINTAIVANEGTGGNMGIGFAVPSNIARHVMDELMRTGKISRGFLGVTLQKIDQDLAAALGLEKTEGALVAEIMKDSPADKAGLKQGDVILKYNGQFVTNVATLRNAVSLMTPGSKLKLSIVRNRQPQEITLDIGSFPSSAVRGETKDEETKLGFSIDNITPDIARQLGVTDDKGVVITKVAPNSPAAWAGLKAGTIILAINQQKVLSVDEFYSILKETPPGRPLLLLVKQGNLVRFVSIKVS